MRHRPLRSGLIYLLVALLQSGVPAWAQPTAPAAPAEARAARPGRFHVLVFLDRREAPLAGVTVSAPGAEAVTNQDGAVRIDVPPGEHPLTLLVPRTLLPSAPADVEAVRAEIPAVKVVSRETSEVIVTLDSAGGVTNVLTEIPEEGAGSQSTEDDFEKLKQERAPGVLVGTVRSVEGKGPVVGARVFVLGAPVEGVTDAQGRFRLELPSGTYSLSVVHAQHSSQNVPNVTVPANAEGSITVELSPAAHELEEYEVIAPHVEGGVAAVMDERRETASVADVLGAEQMSKAGDSDAAGALKRVTGVTIVGGRFIYVRGLGERYSSTLLNGADLPSPDPTRRVIPVDLFPTGVLSSIVVLKTYSPELPGDFSGGVVQLRTIGLPERFTFKLSLSGGVNTQTTFRDGLTYKGASTDWLGYGESARQVPDAIQKATNNGEKTISDLRLRDREPIPKMMPHNYDTDRTSIPPNFGVGLDLGHSVNIGDFRVGAQVSGEFANDWYYRNEEINIFEAGNSLGQLKTFESLTRRRTAQEVGAAVIGVAGIEWRKLHRLVWTSLITRKSLKLVDVDAGIRLGGGVPLDVQEYLLRWNEQELRSHQIRGEHTIPQLKKLKLDWTVSLADASRIEPDVREYSYQRTVPEAGGAPGPFLYSNATPLIRSWETLQDESTVLGTNAQLPAIEGDKHSLTLSVGVLDSHTERDTRIRRFKLDVRELTPALAARQPNPRPSQVFAEGSDFQINDANFLSDSYTADSRVTGVYLAADAMMWNRLRLQGGTRVEDALIRVTTTSTMDQTKKIESKVDQTNVLPGVTATIFSSESTQVRAAYSQTVNRPQLRELADVFYRDPETRFAYLGNPNLKPASITNYDLRFEWYWTTTESLSLGGFYKSFRDPIEVIIQSGSLRTFNNIDSARNMGVELDFRHELDRWSRRLRGFFVGSNVSVIRSRVSISEEDRVLLTTTDRPMQGQSPWIINSQVGYEDEDSRLSATLSFNVIGPRIFEVGQQPLPDSYEQPAPLLDVVLAYRITDRFKLGFKARNLLNPDFEVRQGGLVQRRFKRGINLGASLTYDF